MSMLPPADPLAGLRPWQLPDPPPFWPPAPGWWALAGLALAALALGWWWRRRARQRRTPAALAAAELALLAAAWRADGDTAAYVRGLSTLLRRFVLVAFPGHLVAGLTGERWLAFLATRDDGTAFRDGVGRRLLDAPYRPVADADAAALGAAVARWIARCGRLPGDGGRR